MAALGGDPDTVEVPILQFVHLVHEGGGARDVQAPGRFVTLDDLLDAIGVDATRFFMLRSSHDRTIDLDLELAAQAVGREPGVLRPVRARPDRLDAAAAGRGPGGRGARRPEPTGARGRWSLPERELIKKLASFPEEVAEAAERRAPHRITQYAARARPRVHHVLRGLQGGRGDAGGGRVVPDRAVGRRAADDRAVARPARGQRAGVDVGLSPGSG